MDEPVAFERRTHAQAMGECLTLHLSIHDVYMCGAYADSNLCVRFGLKVRTSEQLDTSVLC